MASDRLLRPRGLWLAGLVCSLLGPGAWAEAEKPNPKPPEHLGEPFPGQRTADNFGDLLSAPTAEARWRGLPQFGRELFRAAEERFGPVQDGPVGPDYVLGPGDNLVVFISSYADTSFALTLDREGKVFLPRVGTTFLWGLTFADAEKLIQSRLASVLRNARVQVSMGRVRALDIFVLGAVERPGKVTLTGLATAFNALYAAGGPNALGSLRDIRVLRADREVARLDLYRFLLEGDRSTDPRLQSGDVVFVGIARRLIGIQGAVMRPGVYEANGPLTLKMLLDMAGGASPFADLERIHIERVDAHGGFRLQDLPLNHGRGVDPDSLELFNYDLITILPLNERVKNVVTLDGFVRHPGAYELSPGLRLSQLANTDRLLPEADLDQAELRRVDPATFQVTVRAISIKSARAGIDDPALQPMDAITIYSGARFPKSATLEGQVVRPGSYTLAPGERLSEVLRRAGGVTAQGFLPGAIFLRKSAAERERAFIHEFVERQKLDLAQQQARLAHSGDSTGAQAALAAQSSLTTALEEQTDPGRVVLDLDEDGKWVESVRDPVLENGDRLIVPLRPATVTVLGSVMNPGTLMARRSATFADYIKLAGGLARDADPSRSYVLRANGEAVPRRAATRVRAGDAIIVPPREMSTGSVGRGITGSARFLIELATAAALIMAARR
jgi:protein involved in polysaccharide export with SLBB domain